VLRLRIFDDGGNSLGTTGDLDAFNLAYQPGHRWTTTTPMSVDTLTVRRDLYAPVLANWMRYVDTFTNEGSETREVYVAWGGNLGSDGATTLDLTSSGDAGLTTSDTWATTYEDGYPKIDPPLGYVLRNAADPTFQGGFIFTMPLTETWPASGEENLGYQFHLTLAPGETARLAYFVARGLAEQVAGPEDCGYYGGCNTPAMGAQITLMRTTAAFLELFPPLCDVPQPVVNWPGAQEACQPVFLPLVQR
jgi:hypothetical protein